MSRKSRIVLSTLLVTTAYALPLRAEDWVEIVKARPASGVIRGISGDEVSRRHGEYIEITVRYNLESDCAFGDGSAGAVAGYWGLDPEPAFPWVVDILPGPDTSLIEQSIDETGRRVARFRWSFRCRADSPPLVSGYVWGLGASLSCASGELDFVEPILGLDYWVIDCSQ
jgi:hypothetical protein